MYRNATDPLTLPGPSSTGSQVRTYSTATPACATETRVYPVLGNLSPVRKTTARDAIVRALAATDGNRRRAAQALGIGLRTLYEKLKRYGIG